MMKKQMKKYLRPEVNIVKIMQSEQIMAISGENFVSDDIGVSDDDMASPDGFWGI